MSGFDDREKAFENKYKHDQDLQFKVEVRRNKLLGLWVGTEVLGLSAAEAEAYAKDVIAADFEEPGSDDVIRKVLQDVAAKGADFSEHRLRNKMDEMLETAKQQVMGE